MRAPTPDATAIAIGVANPKAQGQVTINTAVADIMAVSKPLCHHQKISAKVAKDRVVATNHGITASAVRAMGALLPCASSTRAIIRPSIDSANSC